MDNQNSIDESFLITITNSDLKNVTIELAEVGIDTVLKEGILKDVPIIGLFSSIYRGALQIRDQIFLKKLLHFLSAVKDIPPEQRERMFQKLEEEGHGRKSVGENMLLILDRVDSYNKARLLGLL
jgi:hypothetical protein